MTSAEISKKNFEELRGTWLAAKRWEVYQFFLAHGPMAMKNKMDLSFGIAISSSLQIALFVAPVLIFLSYAFGRPMDLEFTLPEVVAVVVSVYVLFQISSDGETNWIEGIQLLSLYLILGILFFFLPEPQHAAH